VIVRFVDIGEMIYITD